MSLFGNDTDDDWAHTLASNASGSSVTPDRLTKTSGGIIQNDLLATEPAITYLQPDEQPQYFFINDSKGVSRNDATVGGGYDSSYQSLCVVTDKRLLFFTEGSRGETVPISAITDVETSAGHMKHRLTVGTPDYEYSFYVKNSIDGDEVHSCGEYIESRIQEASTATDSEATTVIDGLSTIWDSQLSETPSVEDALATEPQRSYVTEDRYNKIKGVLDPGEKVHFITRGTTVDVEGSSAGQSLFGDDRSRKSGTRGWVRAVITDKRVAVKIPQFLGTDERSVPYSSLTSVDLDTGLVNKRLSLQTPGQTYHIEVQDPGKDEVRQMVRFIRQQVEKANQPEVIQQQAANSEPDPLNQIEKLKQLNDSGAISDEEFDEKKQSLLDDI